MKPISFSCEETLGLAPEDIARQILDLANWTDFKGYGVLPGIKTAEFEVRTAATAFHSGWGIQGDQSFHKCVQVLVQFDHRKRVLLAVFEQVFTDYSSVIAGDFSAGHARELRDGRVAIGDG